MNSIVIHCASSGSNVEFSPDLICVSRELVVSSRTGLNDVGCLLFSTELEHRAFTQRASPPKH